MKLLEFKAVRKRFGKIEALRGVDFEVESGSIVALLGPNGAGKSTLLGCLLGRVLPDAGEILFNGCAVTPLIRTRFGYLPERITLYPHRTVRENGEFIARLKSVNLDAVATSLKRLGLDELRDRKVSQLSKGQLQRTGLAIALAGKPDVLAFDEPFNGLDPLVLENCLEIIREEQRRGATILISTHTISAAEEVASHVAILIDGQPLFAGPLDQLRGQFPSRSLEAIYHRMAKSAARDRKEVVAA